MTTDDTDITDSSYPCHPCNPWSCVLLLSQDDCVILKLFFSQLMARPRATGFFPEFANRINAAFRALGKLAVGEVACEVGGGGSGVGGFFLIHFPHLFGEVDLLELAGANLGSGLAHIGG